MIAREEAYKDASCYLVFTAPLGVVGPSLKLVKEHE